MAREVKKSAPRFRWRLWARSLIGLAACVSTGYAGLKVREYALTDAQFQLARNRPESITVQGLEYASRSKVQSVFAADFDRSIFSVPLAERRRRLLAIDWVESATVSRILPRRLIVRIHERRPVAFCVLRGHVFLIDAFGVLLDQPAQARFTLPVLQGVDPDEPEAHRQDRVAAMLRLQSDLGAQAKDVSEINAADIENIRIVAQVEGRAVELILGDGNFSRRYQNFSSHYPEIHRRSPDVRVFDLRLDDRITVKD